MEELAIKDVQQACLIDYTIVSDIPTDRTFRDAWEDNFTEPDGYGGWYEYKCKYGKSKKYLER